MDIRRMFTYDHNSLLPKVCPNNQIWYTSSNETIITPNMEMMWGVTVVSNTYDEIGIIEFSRNIYTIGEGLFADCTELTSVVLPNSVESIGDWAFARCNLTSITIPENVYEIGGSSFVSNPNLYEFNSTFATEDGRCLILDGALKAFAYAGLSTYDIPENVTAIKQRVFSDWVDLTNIIIPEGITSIENYAFSNCSSLTTITIPSSVESLGYYCFDGCYSLTSIYCKSTAPQNYAYDLGYVNENLKIYVPNNSYYKYYSIWGDLVVRPGEYTINLNNAWRKSTTISNPDSTLYDGVYESYANKGVNNSGDIMYIDIEGYTNFKLYIRSYAESSFDYVMVSQLDKTITYSTSYSNNTLIKAHTRGNQKSGTAISNYTLVEFTNINEGSHRISVIYRKDGSTNSGDDRGYVLIPKNQ